MSLTIPKPKTLTIPSKRSENSDVRELKAN